MVNFLMKELTGDFAIVLAHDTGSYLLDSSSTVPANNNVRSPILGHGNELHFLSKNTILPSPQYQCVRLI